MIYMEWAIFLFGYGIYVFIRNELLISRNHKISGRPARLSSCLLFGAALFSFLRDDSIGNFVAVGTFLFVIIFGYMISNFPSSERSVQTFGRSLIIAILFFVLITVLVLRQNYF